MIEKKVLVKELYHDLKDPLSLEIIGGSDGIYKTITSYRIQKPGLALAGYLSHLHKERVQVLGETEVSYINTLDHNTLRKRIDRLFSMGLACFIVTKGLDVPDVLIEMSYKHNVALIRSKAVSSICIERITEYLEERLAPEVSVHGVLVDVFGVGVLITGESGIGKSECALDLVFRGHRLVADDVVLVKKRRDLLWGSSPVLIKHYMEVRGLGIVNIKDLFGVASIRDRKRIDLIVELLKWSEDEVYERISFSSESVEILGVEVPVVRLPVTPGRNITLLIEVAARLHLLKRAGYDVMKDIDKLLLGIDDGGKGIE